MGKRRQEYSVVVDLPDREEIDQAIRLTTRQAIEAREPLVMVDTKSLLILACMAALWMDSTKG